MNKFFTNLFGNSQIASKTPDSDGDFYLSTDGQADHNYMQYKLARIIKSLARTSNDCVIIYGGDITDAGSGNINISEGIAIGKDTDGNERYVSIPALSDVTMPSGWNDDRQIWVILDYDFALYGSTRNNFGTGEPYNFQIQDSYVGNGDTDSLMVDADPNSTPDTKVALGSFKMNGTSYTEMPGERSPDFALASDVTGNADTATNADKADSVVETGSSIVMNMKVFNIGDWDMTSITPNPVAHGLADYTKIRSISVIIRSDVGATLYTGNRDLALFSPSAQQMDGGVTEFDGTNIELYRRAGGIFDHSEFDDTSYNRGWITIWYTD